MIEHRYRAWDTHLKRMSYHVNVYSEGDEWWWAANHVDPDTGDTICSFDDNVGELMQYTGLKDKYRKMVFADDIIKDFDGLYFVYWNKDDYMWCVITGDEDFGCPLYEFEMIVNDVRSVKCEVVGDKWENGDLLK